MMVVLLIKVDDLNTVNASGLVHTFFHETGTETFIHFNIFFRTFQHMFSLERSVLSAKYVPKAFTFSRT